MIASKTFLNLKILIIYLSHYMKKDNKSHCL